MCSLTGHSVTVNNVKFSPDGTRFVSGAGDGLVKIWDVQTQTEVRTT
jgi:WD40 repeat protein